MVAASRSKKSNNGRSAARQSGKQHPRRIGRPAVGDNAVGRDALITKTCELLSKMPPNEVTRAAVARAMRVDPSLIRYYFKDRATLLLAAFELLSMQLSQVVRSATQPSDSAAARLRAMSGALLKIEAAFPFYQRLLLEEIVHIKTPAARKLVQTVCQHAVASLNIVVDAGLKDKSLRRADPLCLWIAMVGMCQFFVASAPLRTLLLKKSDKTFADRYRDFMGELLLNGCGVVKR